MEDRIRKRTEELFRKNSTDGCKFLEREFIEAKQRRERGAPHHISGHVLRTSCRGAGHW